MSRRVLGMLVLICSTYSLAQSPDGNLEGRVQDPTGAAVAGATVIATDKSHNTPHKTLTDSQGNFRFEGLYAGDYNVTATSDLFKGERNSVPAVVRVSQSTSVVLTFHVQGDVQLVEVNDKDVTSSVLGTPVTEHEIQDTPLANRSFANIAYIAPMTAPVEPSDPTKARITAVSFAGSSGLNVDLSVDGGDNNDDYIGGFLQYYSPEVIREFNVRTSQFDPETSRTNGGSVIISTESGTNVWHGSASGFFRSDAFNARNRLDNPEPNPKQPFSKQDYVGTIGGPIRKDKLWFFSSFEYNRENASTAYSAQSLSEFTALSQLASSGQIPGVSSIAVPTSATTPFRDSVFDSRVDWQQPDVSRWFLRFSLDRSNTVNDLVQQGALPSTGFTTVSNYYSLLLKNDTAFGNDWSGSLTADAALFDHNKQRNSNIGLALAFPFSTTALTTSGFETFGDNQFQTGITAFPIERDQQKYQFRYDVARNRGTHALRFGFNLIHEPVLRGRFSDSAGTLAILPEDPTFYVANPGTFAADFAANASTVPAEDGRFAQSIRRFGFYGQDEWKATPHLSVNFGLRYDTTFGLFVANGKDQNSNPAVLALRAAGVPFGTGVPTDYRGAVSPRLGIAYAPGDGNTVFRAGMGLYYNDLAQNGWAQAFQAVNGGPNPPAAVIDPNYHSPYAIQSSAAVEHQFGNGWRASMQFERQQGVHQYRRYEYISGISLPAAAPDTSVFKSDNRSIYNGASVIVQHHGAKADVTAHYTFARATTWGATVGELFDYVNGVTNVTNPFGPGDHGPSGEDIRHRLVINGIFRLPYGFEIGTLAQFESARPYTMFTPVDINNDGAANDRAVVNGVQTTLDQFRGAPFNQVDLRVSRDFKVGEKITFQPFAEFFNIYNRTNPGNNFIPDISALPVNDTSNATALCLNASCTLTKPITSINDLRVPAGALGDFFGPGTTVGNPFAMQLGFRLRF